MCTSQQENDFIFVKIKLTSKQSQQHGSHALSVSELKNILVVIIKKKPVVQERLKA